MMVGKARTVSKKLSKRKKGGKNEVELLKNQLTRALADYDNLRKRVEREREEFGNIARVTLMARLLPVFDMLEGAQVHLKDSGLAITIEEFVKVLREEGIEKIGTKMGDAFDEEIHEVVEVDGSPDGEKGKEGEITKVILSGWTIKRADLPAGRQVIRPVKVKAGKKG
jgi:molecular chaperone GrpE